MPSQAQIGPAVAAEARNVTLMKPSQAKFEEFLAIELSPAASCLHNLQLATCNLQNEEMKARMAMPTAFATTTIFCHQLVIHNAWFRHTNTFTSKNFSSSSSSSHFAHYNQRSSCVAKRLTLCPIRSGPVCITTATSNLTRRMMDLSQTKSQQQQFLQLHSQWLTQNTNNNNNNTICNFVFESSIKLICCWSTREQSGRVSLVVILTPNS